MRWYQNLAFGLIYTFGFSFLVFITIGDGQYGAVVFLSLLMPWVLFLVAAILAPFARNKLVLPAALVGIALYYLIASFLTILHQFSDGGFEEPTGC
jgi:hypothetical protein